MTAEPAAPEDAQLARMMISAGLFGVFGLDAVTWLITSLSFMHYGIDSAGADRAWAPWYDIMHPQALIYWSVAMLLGWAALVFWLRRCGVLERAVHIGPRTLLIMSLATAAAALAWITSNATYMTALALTGAEDLEIYKDGLEWELTRENALGDFMSGVIAAPLYEETLFRGFIFSVLLARGWKPLPVLLVTSAMFAYGHHQYTAWAVFDVFVTGMILGGLRLWTGGLFAPILCHAILNLSISVSAHQALAASGG